MTSNVSREYSNVHSLKLFYAFSKSISRFADKENLMKKAKISQQIKFFLSTHFYVLSLEVMESIPSLHSIQLYYKKFRQVRERKISCIKQRNRQISFLSFWVEKKNVFPYTNKEMNIFMHEKTGKQHIDLFHILERISYFFSICKFLTEYTDQHRHNKLLD